MKQEQLCAGHISMCSLATGNISTYTMGVHVLRPGYREITQGAFEIMGVQESGAQQ